MVLLGNIVEINGLNEVSVDLQGTTTDFIPYLQFANGYKTHFTPPRIGEQVLILCCEKGDFRAVIGGLFTDALTIPAGASGNKEITKFSDGTIISYDVSNSTFEFLNAKTINIKAGEINVNCDTLNATATDVNVKSQNVKVEATAIDMTAAQTTIKSETSIIGNVTIAGGISQSGGAGGGGSTSISDGNINTSGNIDAASLNVSGAITDGHGDLTNHQHATTDGETALPR